MCVTSAPALISNTQVYAYVPPADGGHPQRHLCGYQNQAKTRGPNCMFLDFAGDKLVLVPGPEYTRNLMNDITRDLPTLEVVPSTKGQLYRGRGVQVQNYGDYTVLAAKNPSAILDELAQVDPLRRPERTPQLEAMADFYTAYAPNRSFVLACFNGEVRPKHPIVVSYVPHDPEVLTIPGLDGHDGHPPTPGAPVYRNFQVAFGHANAQLPHQVRYSGPVNAAWAPPSVGGFVDNREDGPNGDYTVQVWALRDGLTAASLSIHEDKTSRDSSYTMSFLLEQGKSFTLR